MKYLYYKDKQGNFGDDLNAWLWPKFFKEDEQSDDVCFVGIGSILYNDFPEFKKIESQKKVVFGSGIRPYHNKFQIDDKWDIKFLRGPLSAGTLNNKFEYIADSAYALSLVKKDLLPVAKKYKVSVIPYFRSLSYFNWKKICDQLGYHYISPLAERGIEYTINEIAASESIICEAMHGAIIADIMRVPWHRYVLTTPETEGERVGEFKWMDWLYSIDLKSTDATYIKFYEHTRLNNMVKSLTGSVVSPKFLFKKAVYNNVLDRLSKVNEYYLSGDTVLDDINSKISDKIFGLKSEYGI